jgi:hypothetical protein
MGLDMFFIKKINAEKIVEDDIQRRLSKAYAYGDWKAEKQAIEKDLGYPLPVKEYTWMDKETYIQDLEANPDNDEVLLDWAPVSVGEMVTTWRKFNALHNWFVKNVQDGVDDCDEYEVTQDHLEMLELTLEMVFDEKNQGEDAQKKLLPTKSGFFFGGTEYDDYYFKEAKRTLALIKDLREEDTTNYKFYYSSSW